MVDVDVNVDTSGLRSRMALLRRHQIPFAMTLTLNRLAWKTVGEEQEEIKRVFDRPTRFTVQALHQPKAGKATKQNDEAFVWFKSLGKRGDAIENTLRPNIEGGARNVKSTEHRLRQAGVISNNEWIVAARGGKLDKYGNVRPSVYKNLLAFYRTFTEGGYNVGAGRQGVRYEIVPEGRGRVIYEVSRTPKGKSRYRPRFFLTTREPKYKKRFDFYGIADKAHAKHGPAIADKSMLQALRTARK